MPRSIALLALPLSLALASGCRPSKAEFDALQAQLDQVQAQQVELSQTVAVLDDRASTQGDADRFERAELEDAVIVLIQRLAQLEERMAPPPAPERPAPGRPDPEAVYKVEIGDAPVKGPDTALVTIVMWTDYQCPYCARVQDTLEILEKEYGSQVRFVHKHNPLSFHPRAMPAALAAEAARRQDKFWKMSDKLFDNQKELTDANFRRWAKKLGLKVKRFEKDMDDPKLEQHIEQDQAQGMELGARGTPAFFINGRFLSGAQPLENFRALIDEEMAKAKTLVGRGVAPNEVYAVTIAEGRTKV